MAHGFADELAKSREDARLRKLGEREMRRPPDEFFADGWDARPFRPTEECARAFGVDKSTVTRWYAWVRHQDAQAASKQGWSEPERGFPESFYDLEVSHIRVLLRDFLWFSAEFFRTARGEPPMVPRFHRRWILHVLKAIVTGGRLVILSPPRHGKTELLIRFCLWLICRFPNIRIIWVGGNEELAEQAVASVKDHLEENEALAEAFCGPGGSFRPDRKQGSRWSATKFTVATRTIPGLKQPTMRAVGRGGRLRSQDTDFIVCDDIEDEKSTTQPATRDETRRWWTTGPDSRKEEHTALFYIGSRAHPDDLAGYLLENPEYDRVVESAHDPACDLPPEDEDAHIDCMLFPELRSYRWLMQQKRSSQTVGGAGIFDMLYQNLPTGDGLDMFTKEAVLPCRSEDHVLGRIPKPDYREGEESGSIRLVAGLDPSGSGYQAAVLWAYQVSPDLKMWLVDLENRQGGGIPAARDIIRRWWEKYRCAHWVVEENLYHGGIVDDDKIREFAGERGVVLEHFRTYRNKIDPRFGVTSMQPLFAARQIVLPYGDTPSKEATDLYVRQLLHYDGRAPRNRNSLAGNKTDLVMAGWFPMDVIRRALTEAIAEMGVEYDAATSISASTWSTAPWGGSSFDTGFSEAAGF